MAFGDDIQRNAGNLLGDWKSPIDHDLPTKCDSWLVEGVRYIANRVKQTDANQLFKFAEDRDTGLTSETTTDSAGTKYKVFHESNYGEVLYVYKKDSAGKKYISKEVDRMIAPYLGDTNSIYYATAQSPAHFISGDFMTVYPSGSGTDGFIQVRYDTALTTASTDIAYFPDELHILPILYASEQVLKYKLSVMRDRLPDAPNYDGYTEVGTSGSTVDGVTTTSTSNTGTETLTGLEYGEGWNAVRFYIENEEDIEIAGAKMQELNAEQQLFVTDYSWLQGQLQEVKEEFEQQFGAAFGVLGG